ncbi:hypothetical protein Pst134EB_028372 [Puccinia striiformis f. sp. tritici]|uniref:RING-type domain-containing protein n=1 Tax=Puccinia striiformis f. sp. tritici PST-78 TaxID=1165861 RepID=A0A0L0VE28_9BASI|nr:hypothetical protein Pst134EB_028372 [Puccinia striiformis f. sp. tritici]KNE97562.1 hypothetical protein PSTG_09114 [Puccinia striiformis f. sp. tritici PST-78]
MNSISRYANFEAAKRSLIFTMFIGLIHILLVRNCFGMESLPRSSPLGPRGSDHHTIDLRGLWSSSPTPPNSPIDSPRGSIAISDDHENSALNLVGQSDHQIENPLTSILICSRPALDRTSSGDSRGSGIDIASSDSPEVPTVTEDLSVKESKSKGKGKEVVPHGSSLSTDCPICFGETQDQKSIKNCSSCWRGYHNRCIKTWLMQSESCPTCQQPFKIYPPTVGGQLDMYKDQVELQLQRYSVRTVDQIKNLPSKISGIPIRMKSFAVEHPIVAGIIVSFLIIFAAVFLGLTVRA